LTDHGKILPGKTAWSKAQRLSRLRSLPLIRRIRTLA
jgi:hypothetical protein